MSESGPIGLGFEGWRATGIGSLPGTDPEEAATMVAGELPDWAYLPELPARGPGADMIGRAMHLLAAVSREFAVETSSDGWRLTAAKGRELTRAETYFRSDCDAVAERFADYSGPFTVALAGPWTLASAVTDTWGERTLRDRGYLADLCQAHGEAVGQLVARMRRLLPNARIVVSLDEPSLAAVHDGEVPFSSGYRRHRAVPADELANGLRWSRDAARAAGAAVSVHTCAPPVWPVLAALRPDAISIDVSRLVDTDAEAFGTWLESGHGTVWGVWPTTGPAHRDEADRSGDLILRWLHRLGIPVSAPGHPGAVSPRCGMAGLSPSAAVAAMRGVGQIARRLNDVE